MRQTITASRPIHEERETARNLPPRNAERFTVELMFSPQPWYANPATTSTTNAPVSYQFDVIGRRGKKWDGVVHPNGERRYIERFSPDVIFPKGNRKVSPDIIKRNKGASLLRALRDAIIAHVKDTNGTLDGECAKIMRSIVDVDWSKARTRWAE